VPRKWPVKRRIWLLAGLGLVAVSVILLERWGSEQHRKWVEVPVTPALGKENKN
jgi:hypothetical protein